MSSAVDSKSAAAYLIDPLNAPEPSQETGLNSSFAPPAATRSPTTSSPRRESLSSNNPFRSSSDARRSPATPPAYKDGATTSERRLSTTKGSPRQAFPAYRAEAFADYEPAPRRSSDNHRPPPSYEHATSPTHRHRRRTSSLRERYPGDLSHQPLDMIKKDGKRADRSPHLKKHHLPGPDTIDKLDPAIGGRSYHHEGPFDAALLARNTSYENAPIAALRTSNAEALKATPAENIKDAVERHKPLDGVAVVPPGQPDRFGRVYNYEEGADLLREDTSDGPGYKRWGGKDYSPDDLKGESEPAFSLDRALQAHKISDDGIEMAEGSQLKHGYDAAKRNGTLDSRDPVQIAGGESKYVDMELAHTHDIDTGRHRAGSIREGLKKRIGSLRKKKNDD